MNPEKTLFTQQLLHLTDFPRKSCFSPRWQTDKVRILDSK